MRSVVEPLLEQDVRPTGSPWRPGRAVALAVAVGAVFLVAALLLSGGGPKPASVGLPDAGMVTGWALPLARLAFDLCAVGTIGCLLVAAVLTGTAREVGGVNGRLPSIGLRAMRATSWWAGGWCAATLAVLVLSLSDIVGVPVAKILPLSALRSLPWTVPLSVSLILTALPCLVVVGFARRIVTRTGARALLVLAVVALVPVLFTGHAAATANHDLATQSLVVHVIAATLWVGGLLALLVCVRADEQVLSAALPRFSTLALGCFILVGLSGAFTAFLRLGLTTSTWFSPYGALLVAKAMSLVLLGWIGREHRLRAIPAVLAGRPRAFLRLAVGEIVLMAAVIGLAVALGRTPAPRAPGAAAAPAHGGGHDTLSWEVLPWSPATVLTEWRLDAVVLTAVGLAGTAYLIGVRSLARRGQRWPRRRTASAMAGLGTATFALCGGMAGYSTALFSMQVAQVMAMATVVPLLLTLGMPLTLAVQVRCGHRDAALCGAFPGPPWPAGRAARVLANPVNGLLLLVAVLVGLYATPLFELSLRYFALHLLVNVLVLAGGLVFFWSAMGADDVPQRRALADRALFVSTLLLFLMAFGAVLVASDGLYGADWFTELGWAWVDPVADQRRGGAVVWGFALALAPVSVLILRAQSGHGVMLTPAGNQRRV